MTEITNTDAIKAWSRASQEIVVNFGDEGDFIRRYLLNPVIFELLGSVAGKTILDAGCGQGYLSRLLANKGAMVTGIEPAEPWYTYAVQREQAEQPCIPVLRSQDQRGRKKAMSKYETTSRNARSNKLMLTSSTGHSVRISTASFKKAVRAKK